MLVESVEQLVVNSDLSSTTLQALQEVVEKFHCLIDCPKTHALVLVRNKFLGLYSSRNATPLSAADILFLILVNNMTYASHSRSENDDTEASDEEYYETSSSAVFSMTSESNSESNGESDMMHSYKVLLTGPDSMPKCLPHLVHISSIGDHIDLLLIIENGNASISSNLYETFFHLNTIQSVQMQREAESLRPAFEKLDSTIKKLCDSLKKSKNSSVDSYYKQLTKKWEVMRKKYLEFLKSGSGEALVRAESYTMGLLDTLKELFHQTSYDEAVMEATTSLAKEVTSSVRDKMKNFTEFLGVKALRNFTLGSYPFVA